VKGRQTASMEYCEGPSNSINSQDNKTLEIEYNNTNMEFIFCSFHTKFSRYQMDKLKNTGLCLLANNETCNTTVRSWGKSYVPCLAPN
jgi:hypothetical protein